MSNTVLVLGDEVKRLVAELQVAQKERDEALTKVEEFKKEVMPRSEFLDLLEERDSLRKWQAETYKAWDRIALLEASAASNDPVGQAMVPLDDHSKALAELNQAQALIKRLQESLAIEHEIAIDAIEKEMEKPLLTMFQKCIEGNHDKCIGQSDKLFRSGRMAKCSCDCHKPSNIVDAGLDPEIHVTASELTQAFDEVLAAIPKPEVVPKELAEAMAYALNNVIPTVRHATTIDPGDMHTRVLLAKAEQAEQDYRSKYPVRI